MQPRSIVVAGQALAQGRLPAVCAPLVARSAEALAEETRLVAAKAPDLLEWRADFFEAVAEPAQVLAAARAISAAAAGIPLLFTLRTAQEGGQPTALAPQDMLPLYRAVCASGLFALADFEMAREAAQVAAVREATRAAGVGLVLSFHDFLRTPPHEALLARYRQAEALGADLAKLAVMPAGPADVLRLMQATLEASAALAIPVAGMAMGSWGAVSRLCGGEFGSALTFAVGASSSAPGQMPIADVREGLEILARARRGPSGAA